MAKVSLTTIRSIFRGRAPKEEKKLDTTPIAMPLGAMHPTPLSEIIARMVRQAVQEEQGEEFETLEESDDFEIDDDELLDLSPYEFDDLIEDIPIDQMEERQEAKPDDLAEAERKPSSDVPKPDPASEPEPEPQ